MERRTFLMGAGTALSSMRAWGANDRVNLAVVGVGGRGSAHVKYYLRLKDAPAITALCDVNNAATEKNAQVVYNATQSRPKEYQDLRKLYESKDVDAVSIATPNHWHSPAAIWAMQAGKDVYGEKPASYNIYEGQQMVACARKHNRICQIGMQSRSTPHIIRAMQLLHDGYIGKVYLAKGLCFKRRKSIGKTPPQPVPPGINWDIFLGPAPMREFTMNRFKYNWHWMWDTGNGDIGNQGIHEMDKARWGLGTNLGLPKSVFSSGGHYLYDDDQETPNTQTALFDYGDRQLQFEVRGLPTDGEGKVTKTGDGYIGNIFMGEKGYMTVDDSHFETYLGEDRTPGEKGKWPDEKDDATGMHMENFLKAVKSRKFSDLTCDVQIGVTSVHLVHMANISYRTGRKLTVDEANVGFVGDKEANAMRTRPVYRKPYVISEKL